MKPGIASCWIVTFELFLDPLHDPSEHVIGHGWAGDCSARCTGAGRRPVTRGAAGAITPAAAGRGKRKDHHRAKSSYVA